MEKNLDTQQETESNIFCQQCKIYMCKKCDKLHSELYPNHHQCKPDKGEEIFTGICKENNHPYILKYFCKTHNQLCCAECITKFKGKDHGQHTDCNVCSIEDIENEKKKGLKENIKILEDLSINLQQSIKELNIIFEKIEKNKEEIKINIQKIFTKIRNVINDREDELLLSVDKEFNGDIIKKSQKLPNKVKLSLEKGKYIEQNWKNNNLNSLIYDCLNIENNINEINEINMSLKQFNSNRNEITFIYGEKEINQIFEKIKNFGKIKNIFDDIFSNIIKKDDFDKISEWIGGNNKFILIYSAKNDGCNTDIFHEKCDNIGGCVIFVK